MTRPGRLRRAVLPPLCAVIALAAQTAAARASSGLSVDDVSVPWDSGTATQTITLAGPVIGSSGAIVVTADTAVNGLVLGLAVSPSTHGTCTQSPSLGFDFSWRCVPSSTWGAGTFALRLDTDSGGSGALLAPGTTAWPDAETTSVGEAAVAGAQATGTVSMLPPVTGSPSATPPASGSPQPPQAQNAGGAPGAGVPAARGSLGSASSAGLRSSGPPPSAGDPASTNGAQAAALNPGRSRSAGGSGRPGSSLIAAVPGGIGLVILLGALILVIAVGTGYLLRRHPADPDDLDGLDGLDGLDDPANADAEDRATQDAR